MPLKNIVLDLDNTLISAEAIEDFPFDADHIENKVAQFKIHNMDNYYIIFERPGVQKFLDFLFETYTVSVWTAASKDYALYIIKHIILTKPNRRLNHILFSYHCDISRKKYGFSKKLDLISDVFKPKGYTLENTVIIDDLPEVHECQPERSLLIEPFEILGEGCENDTVLEDIKKKLLNMHTINAVSS